MVWLLEKVGVGVLVEKFNLAKEKSPRVHKWAFRFQDDDFVFVQEKLFGRCGR